MDLIQAYGIEQGDSSSGEDGPPQGDEETKQLSGETEKMPDSPQCEEKDTHKPCDKFVVDHENSDSSIKSESNFKHEKNTDVTAFLTTTNMSAIDNQNVLEIQKQGISAMQSSSDGGNSVRNDIDHLNSVIELKTILAAKDMETHSNQEITSINSEENDEDVDGSCTLMNYRETEELQVHSSSSSIDSSEGEPDNKALDSDLDSDEDEGPGAGKKGKGKKGLYPLHTKGELTVKDLPPLEDLAITVDEKVVMVEVGKISAIVDTLVIVQACVDLPPLNIDTILFLEERKVLGQVFETFGPVSTPLYSVRFNTVEQIEERELTKGVKVFYAPDAPEFTQYVFMQHLQQLKGSDASWEHNNEPPNNNIDYSDDEQERRARSKKAEERRRERGNEGQEPAGKKKRNKWKQNVSESKENQPSRLPDSQDDLMNTNVWPPQPHRQRRPRGNWQNPATNADRNQHRSMNTGPANYNRPSWGNPYAQEHSNRPPPPMPQFGQQTWPRSPVAGGTPHHGMGQSDYHPTSQHQAEYPSRGPSPYDYNSNTSQGSGVGPHFASRPPPQMWPPTWGAGSQGGPGPRNGSPAESQNIPTTSMQNQSRDSHPNMFSDTNRVHQSNMMDSRFMQGPPPNISRPTSGSFPSVGSTQRHHPGMVHQGSENGQYTGTGGFQRPPFMNHSQFPSDPGPPRNSGSHWGP